MKFEEAKIPADKTEIVNQAEENKVQWSLINKMHKGHTMWEINLDTGETNPAKFDDGTDVVFNSRFGKEANLATVTRKIKMNKNCVYIPALKKLGAINKFAKQSEKLLKK